MFAYLMRTSQAQIFELESPIIDEQWFNVRYIESLWSIFKSDLGYWSYRQRMSDQDSLPNCSIYLNTPPIDFLTISRLTRKFP